MTSCDRALARAIVALAAELGRIPGPDALARRVGPDDALTILEAAGFDTAAVPARWAADAPARPAQPQRQQADIFTSDPMHAPAVVQAQIRGGDVRAALREVAVDMSNPLRAQKASLALDFLASGHGPDARDGRADPVRTVADAIEAAERQMDKGRRHQDPGGLPVALGVSAGPDGSPRQRSAVHTGTPELGREV